MNDLKNVVLAWASSSTAIFAAVDAPTLITVLSAVVLPIIFFVVGKTVDVLLQVHFRRTEKTDKER
jgi:hypothetical protein